MFLGSVDDLDIIRTVQNCKNKRSTDFSDISMSLVKKVIPKIVKPFAVYVSFQTGVFPNKITITNVIPLYKSGGKRDEKENINNGVNSTTFLVVVIDDKLNWKNYI